MHINRFVVPWVLLLLSFSLVPLQAAPARTTCPEIEGEDGWIAFYLAQVLNCASSASPTPTATARATAAATKIATAPAKKTAALAATKQLTTPAAIATRLPTATRARPTAPIRAPKTLTQLVSDQIVTAVYADPAGTLYYGVAEKPEFLAETLHGGYSLWKKSPGSEPKEITPRTNNVIGGVTVRGGVIYFNEAGTLRRMSDDGNVHEGEVVIRFANLSKIYGHVNASLAQANVNGQEALLIGVGSVRDSAFPAAGAAQDVQIPYYEDFPTGRILYAAFAWLENAHEYNAVHGIAGQFDEMARGVRNPWGMAVGVVNGKTHILAADNDPAFTPEKNDSNPNNAGDELNDIFIASNYGHPFVYGNLDITIGDIRFLPPIVVFPDGSVPSGVAIANGKVFVALQNASMIVKVDIARRTFTPVLTNVQPYNLFGTGNLLYVADFGGIRVIDATGL